MYLGTKTLLIPLSMQQQQIDGQAFFTGGIMPSEHLFSHFSKALL